MDAKDHAWPPFGELARRISLAAVIALGVLFIVMYAADFAVAKFRMARGGASAALSTVTVLYAAPLHGDKVSVFTDQPDKQTCVRSIFPQLGYIPCWYLRRHAVQVID